MEQVLNSISEILEENDLDQIGRRIEDQVSNAREKQRPVWDAMLTILNKIRGII